APRAKLDLVTTIDFRMTSSCTYSDIVLPAATWYEKHDISSTDMHPFVHSFNPAIAPPWETRTDFDAFAAIAAQFSRLAAIHLGKRTDVIAAPLMHDSPDELAQPGGVVRDWKHGQCDPVPGVTMPRLTVVERDYAAVAEKMAALGPLADLAGERAGERISFADTQVQPRAVITSPEWSGSETGGRRYSPFVVNVERKKPWHTLTGRMHFFLDHDWIAEYGEWLPAYRPPL